MSDTIIELGLLLACISLGLSFITIMVYKTFQNYHQQELKKMTMRVNYLEVALYHHDIIPLPWEIEEFENRQTKDLKKEGNVVYLKE